MLLFLRSFDRGVVILLRSEIIKIVLKILNKKKEWLRKFDDIPLILEMFGLNSIIPWETRSVTFFKEIVFNEIIDSVQYCNYSHL